MPIDSPDTFGQRHIGPDEKQQAAMLRVIGARSLDALIDAALPAAIRLKKPLQLPPAETEHEYLDRLRGVAAKNQRFKSFIGMGYYGTITPSVILRCLFENPSWYTPYTPYQAEIAQGRLESLLNFQTMVRDLTAMEVATASLLDEATAAGEAMTLLHRVQARQATGARDTFWVSERTYPQVLDVLKGRAEPLGITIVMGDPAAASFGDDVFGAYVQSPDDFGALLDLRAFVTRAHERHVLVAIATDLLALTITVPPGEIGADVVVGSAQRFGVPMGYGGPHAAFLATREAFVRQAPGRIIGVSIDAHGNLAYRMALQTREQHIRREKATSNICTAQALLANIAAMYGVYHGPDGLTAIARRVHALTATLEKAARSLGYAQNNEICFDTLRLQVPEGIGETTVGIKAVAERAGLNFRYIDSRHVGIALDETTTLRDVRAIAAVLADAAKKPVPQIADVEAARDLPAALARTSPFMTHPVFSSHRSETKMMRYLKSLERKDVGLDRSMIPLGSCTMKLNAASEMIPVTWPEFSAVHPFTPVEQVQGYAEIISQLEQALAEITGFAAVSLQPNSGAQGELAGLMTIRAYHHSRGDARRDVVLIPSSAHGTNPASAVMAALKVVVVATDTNGNVDVPDLKAKAEQHRERLAALMITYPSTHGVFEDSIQEVCAIVHQHGGQVYMDGANMNAQVGSDEPRGDRRRRLSPEPAQDVRHPARRRRTRHGSDWRRVAPCAVPSRTCRRPRWRAGSDSSGLGRAMGLGQHPADLVRVHPHARRRGDDQRDEARDPERQLHQETPRGALRRALHEAERHRRPRDDLRPAPLQGLRRRRARRGQAVDGLRLSRADGLVSGRRHVDDRANRKRVAGRARPVLRGDDRDPPARSRRSSTARPIPGTTY